MPSPKRNVHSRCVHKGKDQKLSFFLSSFSIMVSCKLSLLSSLLNFFYLRLNGPELQRPPFEHKPSPRVQSIEQTQRSAQHHLESKTYIMSVRKFDSSAHQFVSNFIRCCDHCRWRSFQSTEESTLPQCKELYTKARARVTCGSRPNKGHDSTRISLTSKAPSPSRSATVGAAST